MPQPLSPFAFLSPISWDPLRNQPMDPVVRRPQFALTPDRLPLQRDLHNSAALATVSLKWNPAPRGAAIFWFPAQLACTHWRPAFGAGLWLHHQQEMSLLQWASAAGAWPSPFSTVEVQHLNSLMLSNYKRIVEIQGLLHKQLSKRLMVLNKVMTHLQDKYIFYRAENGNTGTYRINKSKVNTSSPPQERVFKS